MAYPVWGDCSVKNSVAPSGDSGSQDTVCRARIMRIYDKTNAIKQNKATYFAERSEKGKEHSSFPLG